MDFSNEVAKPETALQLQKMLGYDIPTVLGYYENRLVDAELERLLGNCVISAPTMREIIICGLIPTIPQNYTRLVISTSTYFSMWYNTNENVFMKKLIHCIGFEKGESLELSEVILDDNFGDAYCRLSIQLISLRLIQTKQNATQN